MRLSLDGIYNLMPSRLISRRSLVASLALLPLFRRSAYALGDSARFIPAVAQHGPRWNVRLSGLRRLTWQLQRRASVEVVPDARAFALSSPRLFEYPFLYWGGEGDFPPLDPDELENLRRYLTFGGFVLAGADEGAHRNGIDPALPRGLVPAVAPAPPRPPSVQSPGHQ